MSSQHTKLDKIAGIIEAELDASMDSWEERWKFPGGVYDDAPPPPTRFGRFRVERVAVAILEALVAKPQSRVPCCRSPHCSLDNKENPMTRLWTMSDLHQEFLREPGIQDDPHTAFDPADHVPPEGFDAVVIAGDVDVPLTRSIEWIGDRFAGAPVIYVPGNHDFFVSEDEKYTMSEVIDQSFEAAEYHGVTLLLDGTVYLDDDTRLVGGTLWTDFATLGRGDIRAKMAEAAGRMGMNDYRAIKRWSTADPTKRKRLRPEDTIAAHRKTRAYIEAELEVPFEGQTVVVTHHAPHPGSLDPRHLGRLDWCYASNLSTILEGPTAPDIWIHGHIHQHQDYHVGGTRIVANPRGYAFVPAERDNGFDPDFVLDLGQPKPRPASEGDPSLTL